MKTVSLKLENKYNKYNKSEIGEKRELKYSVGYRGFEIEIKNHNLGDSARIVEEFVKYLFENYNDIDATLTHCPAIVDGEYASGEGNEYTEWIIVEEDYIKEVKELWKSFKKDIKKILEDKEIESLKEEEKIIEENKENQIECLEKLIKKLDRIEATEKEIDRLTEVNRLKDLIERHKNGVDEKNNNICTNEDVDNEYVYTLLEKLKIKYKVVKSKFGSYIAIDEKEKNTNIKEIEKNMKKKNFLGFVRSIIKKDYTLRNFVNHENKLKISIILDYDELKEFINILKTHKCFEKENYRRIESHISNICIIFRLDKTFFENSFGIKIENFIKLYDFYKNSQ